MLYVLTILQPDGSARVHALGLPWPLDQETPPPSNDITIALNGLYGDAWRLERGYSDERCLDEHFAGFTVEAGQPPAVVGAIGPMARTAPSDLRAALAEAMSGHLIDPREFMKAAKS